MTTRIACVADIHLSNHHRFGGGLKRGANARARLVLDALNRAVQVACDAGADYFVVAGDLFDTVHPEPQLIAAAMEALAGIGVTKFLVRGNHDAASPLPGDDALAPFDSSSNCYVVDEVMRNYLPCEGGGCDLFLIPYRPGNAREWVPQDLHTLATNAPRPQAHRVLVSHVGIIDNQTPPYLANAHDAIEASLLLAHMDAHDVDVAIVGNWHQHRAWTDVTGTRHIVQVGALAPTGFDNPGLEGYGSVILYDIEPRKWTRIEVPGPRFLSIPMAFAGNVAATVGAAVAGLPAGGLFVDRKVAPQDLAAAAAELSELELMLGLGGTAVRADRQTTAVQNRAAAVGAAQAVVVEDAVAAYVDAMPLDGAVLRDLVRDRALGCFKRA